MITDALDYLVSAQADGRWRDFETLAGGSDEWVTAYVAVMLARSGHERARAVARTAARRVVRRRLWSAGWGYNRRVPADADTTAWVLALLSHSTATAPVSRWRARRFLTRHVGEDDGVSTYGGSGSIRAFTGLSDVSFDGWRSSHPSVTAAAVPSLPDEQRRAALGYLRRVQREGGKWRGYWWPNDSYPTALATAVLVDAESVAARASVLDAVEWALSQFEENGSVLGAAFRTASPFATACCLRVLAAGDRLTGSGGRCDGVVERRDATDGGRWEAVNATARDALDWLSRQQNADGSWAASATLQVPPPDEPDPAAYDEYETGKPRVGGVHLDRERTFTTATVLEALLAATDQWFER